MFFLAVVPRFLGLQQPLLPQYLLIGLTLGFTDLVVITLRLSPARLVFR